jgi:myo-inositol-1(or 4)-monophosphatase
MADVRDELPAKMKDELLGAALRFTDEMSDLILGLVENGFSIDVKSDATVVTTADLEAEKLFRARLKEIYPKHGVLGEEFGKESPDADFQWVVDPIDGTAEFARGLPLWGTILALYYKGLPLVSVIDHPQLNTRLHACHGLGAYCGSQRLTISSGNSEPDKALRVGLAGPANFQRYDDEKALCRDIIERHSMIRVYHSCYMHSAAIIGGVDVGIEWNVKFWDLAATPLLVEEAGGVYKCVRCDSQLDSSAKVYSSVFGKPLVVERIMSELGLREVVQEPN